MQNDNCTLSLSIVRLGVWHPLSLTSVTQTHTKKKMESKRYFCLQQFLTLPLHGKLEVWWNSLKRWNMWWRWPLHWYGLSFFLCAMLNLEENILVIPQNMGAGLENGVFLPIWLLLQFTWWQMPLTWCYFLFLLLASILRSQIAEYGQFCHGGHRSVHYRA